MTMHNLLIFLVVFVLVSGCTPVASPGPASTSELTPEAIIVTDGTGKQITLPAPAKKIISLAPANTEILFALGAGSQIIGRDTTSDYPEQAKAITDVGGGFGELNLEAILAQNPDLIIASMLTPSEQTKALEDAGLTVFTLGNPSNFEGLYSNMLTLAKLTGHEAEAEALVGDLSQRVAAVEEKLSNTSQRPLVFYEIDGTDPNAVWTPGPGTFIDTLINLAGGDNLGANLQP